MPGHAVCPATRARRYTWHMDANRFGRPAAAAASILGLSLALTALPLTGSAGDPEQEAGMNTFSLSSPAFTDGAAIPPRYSGDGEDVSPPLHIADPPPDTRSLALIMDDPDAPGGTWVHWVVWNIPPDTGVIEEGALPPGAQEGINSWGREGYGGPAPPSGTHRYFFKLYALDTVLNFTGPVDKQALLEAMEGHVLAKAQLMGRYSHR